MKGSLGLGAGLSAVSTCFQEAWEGCCWVTRTAEDVRGSGQVLRRETGRALKVEATEEQQPWKGALAGCSRDKETGWLETQQSPKGICRTKILNGCVAEGTFTPPAPSSLLGLALHSSARRWAEGGGASLPLGDEAVKHLEEQWIVPRSQGLSRTRTQPFYP